MAEAAAMTLSALQKQMRKRFEAAGLPTPRDDARLLLLETLGISLTDLVTRPDEPVDPARLDVVNARMERRLHGEPVHRILGHREFYGLQLGLSAETLEPRPDTEVLVEALVPYLRRIIDEKGACRILDLGTGAGALALALLSLDPRATAVATDVSANALETASANAAALGLGDRFAVLEGSWFAPVEGLFDIIVSNPPYIRTSVIGELAVEVREHDPLLALDGGLDGLDAYRAIAASANDHLAPGGMVGLEIGFDQREDVTALFEEAGLARLSALKDLGGNDRALIFARDAA
ncbi:peptide chain release factor N(5)-glutamine methyltransferase [Georhizobium profundi]|uniref:Release factor glutamine methyltransferase n=1 Tax=Georhizobium profundi TaxID=2341112 RepID=A0A3S9B955_9HYPH|nr:peptide chain release factor N(5)-glutamine methyltransferase [Georhizobium profundi]AZN73384.1 peptide chain release factor N(5)-glutamine methyltransferase [Georhizobium profundi]